jgi:hypothetical protein
MRALALLAVLPFLLAGCASDDAGAPTPTSSTPPPPEPEGDNAVFLVMFDSEGPATVEVPFPTMDSCRAPPHWMEGNVTSQGATVALGNASDGRSGLVLQVSGSGNVSWSSQVEAGPQCMTFRYDPWSVDPDPEGESVDVRATQGSPADVSVLVRLVRQGCANATLYEGPVAASWSALTGRTLPTSCA